MRSLLFFIIILTPFTAARWLDVATLTLDQSLSLAIFVSIITLWLLELIPLAVTALLVPVLISLYGLQPIEQAISPFGSSILYLFFGVFLLSEAMHKHKLDQRIALTVLQIPGVLKSITSISFALFFTTYVLSMWVSNTATAALMCPIALGIAETLRPSLTAEDFSKVRKFLILGIAFSCSIGGIATPVGSPPNLIAIGLIEKHGYSLGFFDWILFAMPLSFLLFLSNFLLLRIIFKLRSINVVNFGEIRNTVKLQRESLGIISQAEKTTVIVFSITVFLWFLPSILSSINSELVISQWMTKNLSMTAVALISSSLLFLLPTVKNGPPILEWSDSKNIDWGTILLFGGGLCLGAIIEQTGLSKLLATFLLSDLYQQPILMIFVASAVGVILTGFTSNTVTATVLIVILLGMLPVGDSVSAYSIIIAATLATSCSFMLPIATPPNAIAFGTGTLTLKDMLKAGFYLNIISWVLVSVTAVVLLKF